MGELARAMKKSCKSVKKDLYKIRKGRNTQYIKKRDSGTFAQIYIIKRQRSKHIPSAFAISRLFATAG